MFEFMDTDLHNVIKRGNILKDIHKQYIMYQLFKATKYLHSGNVIHRDYKPSNILLNAECFVKVADFGLARSLTQLEDSEDKFNPDGGFLTEYVATRWYRAPEILLASHKYTKAVDMWSLGCILGEMLLEKPLFPGSSTLNQIEKILADIPPPSTEDINSIKSPYGASVLHKTNVRQRRSFQDILPNAAAEAIDLLNSLLYFNPEKRPTAEKSLQHAYVSKFYGSGDEPALDYDVVPPLDDDVQLSIDEYRQKLYEMIIQKKAEIRRNKRNEANKKMEETVSNASDKPGHAESDKSEGRPDNRAGDNIGSKGSSASAKHNYRSNSSVSSKYGASANMTEQNGANYTAPGLASSGNARPSSGVSSTKVSGSGAVAGWAGSSSHIDSNNNSASTSHVQSQLETHSSHSSVSSSSAVNRHNYTSTLTTAGLGQPAGAVGGSNASDYSKYDSYNGNGNSKFKRERDLSSEGAARRGTSAPVSRGSRSFSSTVSNPVIMRGDSRSSAVAMNTYNATLGANSTSKVMSHHVRSPTEASYTSSHGKMTSPTIYGRRQFTSKNQGNSFQTAQRSNFGSFTQSHGTITSSGLEQLRNNLKM